MLSDIPVAFKWQSSGQWTCRVCKSGFKKLWNGTEGGLGSITPSVPPPDTPVTFKWQSSGSWVKFYWLCVIILSDIPVTIQWQSSQTTIHEWHPSDSWVTFEWQFCRWTVTRMSLGCHSNLDMKNRPNISKKWWHRGLILLPRPPLCRVTATGMPIDCQWSVTQQSTATGMLFDCQWSVTLLVTQRVYYYHRPPLCQCHGMTSQWQ